MKKDKMYRCIVNVLFFFSSNLDKRWKVIFFIYIMQPTDEVASNVVTHLIAINSAADITPLAFTASRLLQIIWPLMSK